MTDPLYLAHIPVDMQALARWGAQRGWSEGRATYDEGRALHHLLVECFGESALRPFRLMIAPRARTANLYAYCRQPAEVLAEDGALFALPDQQVFDPGTVRTKLMPLDLAEGRLLGFDLRTRPVRRLKTAMGERFRPGDEVDVFVHEALRRHSDDRKGMQKAERTRETVYLDWLAERLAPFAELDRAATRLVRYRRLPVVREQRVLDGPEAIFHGTLKITRPEKIRDALTGGIGRHGAYGYGMLLLRPPSSMSAGA